MENRPNFGPVRLLVLQANSYCNLDCNYCYLPHRNHWQQLSLNTLEKVLMDIQCHQLLGDSLEVRWHSGEPLLHTVQFYQSAVRLIRKKLPLSTEIKFSIQTNGMLLNGDWCGFFIDNGFRVGISIDGPEAVHNANRVKRSGVGTFKKAMEKIDLLHSYGLSFEVIAVVSSEVFKMADDIYTFFLNKVKPVQVGFNIEETEGIHVSKLFQSPGFLKEYEQFMDVMWLKSKRHCLPIREFEEVKPFIGLTNKQRKNELAHPLRILSVDANGNLSTFSPELLGFKEFWFSNVHGGGLREFLANKRFKSTWFQIREGVEACKKECSLFYLCGGGSPSNKHFENKDLSSTLTNYCLSRFHIPAKIMVADLDSRR